MLLINRFALAFGIVMATFAGAAVQAQTPPSATEAAAYTGVHAAAQRGNVTQLETLAKTGADLNGRDGNGRTPLHVATFAKQREAIRTLARLGADLQLLDHDRYDAVTIASVADDEDSLRMLLSLGASAELITSRYDGTALIAAAHLGHDGVVRHLIAAGAPVNHMNNLHWTAAIEAVVLGDGGRRHQLSLQALIAGGADLRLADRQGLTPLALARSRGYREMVLMLEHAGAR